jgi:hypothetical protein
VQKVIGFLKQELGLTIIINHVLKFF